MNHVDLKPYPFPEGVTIPRLMPAQEFPWNGDGYLAAEVLRLKEAHGLIYAVETGTCLGSTALWLGENFKGVITFEIHEPYFDIAKARLSGAGNIHQVLGSSVTLPLPTVGACTINTTRREDDPLESVFWYPSEEKRYFVFLDAHWQQQCPLLVELSAIATGTCNYGGGPDNGHPCKPCILIHDFQVPGTDFGFDKMPDGRPFNLELIQPYLDRIYGEGKWKSNYPTKVEGARRGWISVEPC